MLFFLTIELRDAHLTKQGGIMKFVQGLITIVLVAVFTSGAEAQIFKKLKKKAQQAIEQKAEDKIDEEMQKAADRMVDNSWDAVFGGMALDEENGELPFLFTGNATTEDVYTFNTVTTMKITSERSNGHSEPPMFMDMHFNKDAQYTGTAFRGGEMDKAGGSVFIIYDFKNAAMVMLLSSEDGKFSFAYDWQQALEYADDTLVRADSLAGDSAAVPEEINWDEVDEWNGYTKIGSRTIAGYNCDGYRSENAEGSGSIEVWVTRDTDFGMANMFKANANTKQLKGHMPEDYPYGMMVEMTAIDENGDKTMMQITDVKRDVKVEYAMADYPAMTRGKK